MEKKKTELALKSRKEIADYIALGKVSNDSLTRPGYVKVNVNPPDFRPSVPRFVLRIKTLNKRWILMPSAI